MASPFEKTNKLFVGVADLLFSSAPYCWRFLFLENLLSAYKSRVVYFFKILQHLRPKQ